MIYCKTTPGEQFDIAIPNNFGLAAADVAGKSLRLEIRNDVGRWLLLGTFSVDLVTPGRIASWVTAGEDAPAEGEYTYRASLDDGTALSEGLLVVGDYAVPRPTEYEKTIEYEQYD